MLDLFKQLGPWAVVDILIIAAIIYRLLLLIRGTRAMQMVIGILMLLGLAFVVSQIYPLTTLKWAMNKFYSSIIIILVIIFQEDIRRVLSRVGKKSFLQGTDNSSSQMIMDELVRTASSLSSNKVGGLIVIERNIILTRYVDMGALLDARISRELLLAVFNPTSPIHDGAVIVQRGRLAAAGCFLPLTRDENIDPNFGTRHRAAIGISQETDALVIVVSEETGAISLVADGIVSRDLDTKELRKALRNMLNQGLEKETSGSAQPLSNVSVLEKLKVSHWMGLRK